MPLESLLYQANLPKDAFMKDENFELVRTTFGMPYSPYESFNSPSLKDNTIERVGLFSYWVAEIPYFLPVPHVGQDELVIAVCSTNKWLRGMLLMPYLAKTTNQLSHIVIELTDWKDPLKQALQEVNIFPDAGNILALDNYNYFSIRFATPAAHGTLNFGPFPVSGFPTFNRLLDAVHRVVYDFLVRIEDQTIRDYIGYERLKYYSHFK